MNRLGILEEGLYKAAIPPLLSHLLSSLVSLPLLFSTLFSLIPVRVLFGCKVLSPYARLWHFGDCAMTAMLLDVLEV